MDTVLYCPELAEVVVSDPEGKPRYSKRLITQILTIRSTAGYFFSRYVTLEESESGVILNPGEHITAYSIPQKTMFAVFDETDFKVGYEIEGMPEIDWIEYIKRNQLNRDKGGCAFAFVTQ